MELVKQLLNYGVSKYRISKELNINWRTVHNWSRGSKPNLKNEEALKQLIKRTKSS